MKIFQPKADTAPPDDKGPGAPPISNITPDSAASKPPAQTDPMPRDTKADRNAEVEFKGHKRFNATHASTTDPDARLCKQSLGTGAMPCAIGHAMRQSRNGLIVQGDLTQTDGQAERRAAPDMIHRHCPGSTRRLTLGADTGHDAAGFLSDLRRA